MSGSTIVIELSSGLMWLIAWGLFWLGICFVVGMKTLAMATIDRLFKNWMQAVEEAKDLIKRR